jgi:hypothetical protein
MKYVIKILIVFILFLWMNSLPVFAENEKIDEIAYRFAANYRETGGAVIALLDFIYTDGSYNSEASETIEALFKKSFRDYEYIKQIDVTQTSEHLGNRDVQYVIDFGQKIGATAVITGDIEKKSKKKVLITARLIDISQEKSILTGSSIIDKTWEDPQTISNGEGRQGEKKPDMFSIAVSGGYAMVQESSRVDNTFATGLEFDWRLIKYVSVSVLLGSNLNHREKVISRTDHNEYFYHTNVYYMSPRVNVVMPLLSDRFNGIISIGKGLYYFAAETEANNDPDIKVRKYYYGSSYSYGIGAEYFLIITRNTQKMVYACLG